MSTSRNIKRVVVTGAESTGKTTLALKLAEHYSTVWVPEYVRAFVEEKGADPVCADVETIARRHLALEEEAARRAKRVLICDTNILSTLIYSRHYFGDCPAWIEQWLDEHPYDLYLLAADDIPWIPDPGVRESPELRALLQRRFERELNERGLQHVVLTGSPDQRMQRAVAAIDPLIR